MHPAAVVERGFRAKTLLRRKALLEPGLNYANRASSIRAHLSPTKSDVQTEQIILAPV